MSTKNLLRLLRADFPNEKFFIQKVFDGEEFYCLLQHGWQDVAKISAMVEKEEPTLYWSQDKTDALGIDRDATKAEWRK
eukprot:5857826-Karenia_brevis.AAC.1